jgi:hypothetical protein
MALHVSTAGPARARWPLFLNRTRNQMNRMNLPSRVSLWNWLPAIVVVTAASLSAAPPTGRADDDRSASQLAEIEPIDTPLHAYQDVPAVADLFSRFNLRALNITLIDDRDPFAKSMEPQWTDALAVRRLTKGRASVSTTIDPYDFETPGFVARVNKRLNADFDAGAIAVKLYKVVGMELKRKDGTYVLPDDRAFGPVFDNIAAHHKTVVAHVAEPDSCWKAPDPKSPDYSDYNAHPEEYAYKHPEWPTKDAILAARDHLLQLHPNLKIVGAHLGSMDVDVDQIAQRFDKYPNFAVDTAARLDYLMMQKPEKRPRVPHQVSGSRGLRHRQRAVPVRQDGERAQGLGGQIRARLAILLERRRREVRGGDREGPAPAEGGPAQAVSRQRREVDSGDRVIARSHRAAGECAAISSNSILPTRRCTAVEG